MRIQCRMPRNLNLPGQLPGLEDCVITTDAGHPVPEVLGFTITAKPGQPIVCHLDVLVSELDVEACPETLRGDPDDRR